MYRIRKFAYLKLRFKVADNDDDGYGNGNDDVEWNTKATVKCVKCSLFVIFCCIHLGRLDTSDRRQNSENPFGFFLRCDFWLLL